MKENNRSCPLGERQIQILDRLVDLHSVLVADCNAIDTGVLECKSHCCLAVLRVERTLSHKFGKAIKPGDRVYLWECGPREGIIGLAEVAEAPRIQPEPAEQLPFIRETEKFAGDQLRVKLRMLKRIEPLISRKYLLSRPGLAGLSILRCARGTNFRVTHEQAAALQKIVEGFASLFPNENGSGKKRRVVLAQG